MDLTNVRSRGHTTVDLYNAYIRWASDSIRLLRHQVSPADLNRFVLTRRYWSLQSLVSAVVDPVRYLIDTEVDERLATLDEAYRWLAAQIGRWSEPGWFVVADTSVYCHAEKLEVLDLGGILSSRGDPVHLLVPIVVVDELDSLKQSSKRELRWRAAYTLAVLDRVLTGSALSARLRESDFSAADSGAIPRGQVTVEIVLDPAGHTRLPINDDEIVDRALSIQALAGRPVNFLTFDTGQSHRARMAGLRVTKLESPLGDEPK